MNEEQHEGGRDDQEDRRDNQEDRPDDQEDGRDDEEEEGGNEGNEQEYRAERSPMAGNNNKWGRGPVFKNYVFIH